MKRIAIFGGGFNPPGVHHRALIPTLLANYDAVLIVPSGDGRPDKPGIVRTPTQDRLAMVNLGYGNISPRVLIDDTDLTKGVYTRCWELQERYSRFGEIWHAIGTDLIEGGAEGKSEIHGWYRGQEIWREFNFAVFGRPGHPCRNEDLPPRSQLFQAVKDGSSTEIRRRVAAGESIKGLVSFEVESYILAHGLYRA
jgi:NAD+ kinase